MKEKNMLMDICPDCPDKELCDYGHDALTKRNSIPKKESDNIFWECCEIKNEIVDGLI